ncbi:MAG: substrate-binding domain-containing protein, partial [Chromatiales bacterium]|nr:substrate-binding domain-containing protein [Chromatiales bacterium]
MQRRKFLINLAIGSTLGITGGALGSQLPRWVSQGGSGCVCPSEQDPRLLKSVSASGDLTYQGTHILTYGAFRPLAQRFEQDTGRRFVVHGGGCDDGITAVLQQTADIGGLCCPVEGTRADGMPWLQVAHDIKVIIAHPSQSLENIGRDALEAVVRGRLRNWRELGGEDRQIALVYRDHCPEYFEPVRALILGNRQAWSPRGMKVDTDQQLVDTVSRFRGAIGLVSWVFVRDLHRAGLIKVLALDGIQPSAAAVRAGRYDLIGPLNLVFRDWREALIEPMFDYLFSPAGQATMTEAL